MARTPSGTQWFGVWPMAIAVLGACTIFGSVAGRELKVGTSPLWGTLILGVVTTTTLTVLWFTAAELFDDWRSGTAEWPEFATASVAAVLALGWMVVWVAQALGTASATRRGGPAGKPPVVWDREIDELIRPSR